jgi:hypothetical protein
MLVSLAKNKKKTKKLHFKDFKQSHLLLNIFNYIDFYVNNHTYNFVYLRFMFNSICLSFNAVILFILYR